MRYRIYKIMAIPLMPRETRGREARRHELALAQRELDLRALFRLAAAHDGLLTS
jgi:hypothetical protein